ncbi:hypothetical protein ANN_27755 [Periplaneta americana]|uniref:Uncharacterized protein n=1 Tax=Periplaneta americana TaxID=6978 RepID=A0ABQ8RV54_PERAM|nr:hypothetical protein ANN_27755 [Periplaneta americana]
MNGRTKARKVERWNKNALSEEEIKVKYMEAIAENMKKLEIEKETIHKIWNLIGKGIEEAAGKIIGIEHKRKRNDWFHEECGSMIEKKNSFYTKMVNTSTRRNEQQYKDRKEAHKLLRKRKYLNKKLETIQISFDNRQAKSF